MAGQRSKNIMYVHSEQLPTIRNIKSATHFFQLFFWAGLAINQRPLLHFSGFPLDCEHGSIARIAVDLAGSYYRMAGQI